MLTQEMRQLFKLFDTDGSEILRIISPPPDRAGAFRSGKKRHTIIVLRKEAEAFSRCPIFFKPKRANFQRDYEDKAEISRFFPSSALQGKFDTSPRMSLHAGDSVLSPLKRCDRQQMSFSECAYKSHSKKRVPRSGDISLVEFLGFPDVEEDEQPNYDAMSTNMMWKRCAKIRAVGIDLVKVSAHVIKSAAIFRYC